MNKIHKIPVYRINKLLMNKTRINTQQNIYINNNKFTFNINNHKKNSQYIDKKIDQIDNRKLNNYLHFINDTFVTITNTNLKKEYNACILYINIL